MPTINEHLRALQKAKAAGDTEAADYIRQQLIEQQRTEDAATYNPTAGNSFLQNLQEGTGRGMMNVVRHLGNMTGFESNQALADAKQLDAPLMQTGGGKVGSFIGETAITAPLTAGAAGLVGRAGALGAKVISNPITRGLIEGTLQGATMADPGNKMAGGILGGVVGGALPAALMGGSKLVRGLTQTPEAQLLRARGVDLTPGQLNPEGSINQLEQAVGSVPYVGNLVKNARTNAEQQFQNAVVGEGAMAPVAQGDLNEMVRSAYDSFQPAYDAAKGFPVAPKIMTTGADIPLDTAFQKAATARSIAATDSQRKAVHGFLQDALTSLGNGKTVQSEDLLNLRSIIRQEVRDSALTGDSAGRAMSGLYAKAEQAVTDALESQLPKDALNTLKGADAKYATYKIIENAAAKAKDYTTGLTPGRLSQALSESLTPGQMARGGGGPLRDLAQAGAKSFQMVSPATGARVATLAVPAAAIMAKPTIGIPATLGMLAMSATRGGRAAAAGELPAQLAAQRLLDSLYSNTPQLLQRGAQATYLPAAVSAQRGLFGE